MLLPASAARPKTPRMNTATCTKTWHIERHNNPWSGLTNDAATEEATYTVRAVTERPAGKNRLTQPPGIDANDFLLFRSGESNAVVVNARYFSNLTRQDVTGRPLRSGGLIGAAKPAALKRWQAAELLGLLLKQQIILTYAHIEADICLTGEQTQHALYSATLTGEHTYYTNSRNVSSFGFEFTLNEKTGEMRVKASK